MKRGTCVKCGSPNVGYFEHVLDAYTSNPPATRVTNQEFRVLSAFKDKSGLLTSQLRQAEVEAYVCTDCGYIEEYVKQPRDLPWDQLPLFRRLR